MSKTYESLHTELRALLAHPSTAWNLCDIIHESTSIHNWIPDCPNSLSRRGESFMSLHPADESMPEETLLWFVFPHTVLFFLIKL